MLLQSGDTIAIVAPAGRVEKDALSPATRILNKWGLKVITGDHVYDQTGYFAGTDTHRLQDFQKALDDPEIKAVLCARGGYGTSRVIDKLDFTRFQKNSKWIIGFSDITSVHGKVGNMGIASIHGPMAIHFGKEEHENAILKLHEVLFGGTVSFDFSSNPLNKYGSAAGMLTGGNLTMITHGLGTPDELNTKGKILLIEDIGEDIYKIDRMLLQLRRAHKLDLIKGLLAGHFTDVKDTNPSFGMNVHEVILSHFPNTSIPIIFDFPSGHEVNNYPVMLGENCLVEATDERVFFSQGLKNEV